MVREVVFDDIKRLHGVAGPWDLLLFTGDLTQKGSEPEFKAFSDTLAEFYEVLRALGSTPTFLAVPGNHDLARPALPHDLNNVPARELAWEKRKPELAKELLGWAEHHDLREEFWANAQCESRTLVDEAFAAYSKWWSDDNPWWKVNRIHRPQLQPGVLPGDWSATVDIDGLTVGIVGLNSAFLQLTDQSYLGRLALDIRQFHAVCDNDCPRWVRSKHVALLLTHHPRTWLSDVARKDLQELVEPRRFPLHLFGHAHRNESDALSYGEGPSAVQVQGCSLFGLKKLDNNVDRRHGYMAGRLTFARDQATLRLWPREGYQRKDGSWLVRADSEFQCESDGGTHRVLDIGPALLSRTTSPQGVDVPSKPHHQQGRVRVSMAAILKMEKGGRYLLVRNLYRRDVFGPIGGVIKYYDEALPHLRDLGYEAEIRGAPKDSLRDLRGFLPERNLKRFLTWFHEGRDRETAESCLRREIKEELREVQTSESIIEAASQLTFQLVRRVTEGPELTAHGYASFRYIEVYEPAHDKHSRDRDRATTNQLFSTTGSDLIAVGADALFDSDQRIASTVGYYFAQRIEKSDTPLAGPDVGRTEAERLIADFLKRKRSIFDPLGPTSDLVLLHRVRKHYSESLVARLSVGGRSCILKYYPSGNQYAQKEDFAFRALRGRLPLLPALLASQFASKREAFLLLEMLEGDRLSDFPAQAVREQLPGVLELVARLAEVPHVTYGEFVGTYVVKNHRDLNTYVRGLLENWKQPLGRLKPEYRKHGPLKPLLEWAKQALNRSHVHSVLSDGPCLCHSDVKLTDIVLTNHGGYVRPVLLDFDNIFAFVPEFDLCKLHLSLIEHNADIDLPRYAEMVRRAFRSKASIKQIEESLCSVYPIVLLRLLQWAATRRAEYTIDKVVKALDCLPFLA